MFNKTGGSTSLTLQYLNQGFVFLGAAGIWTVISDDITLSTLDTRVATLTNKTLTAPVINSPTGIAKADVGLGNVHLAPIHELHELMTC